jgi:gamma-carbonic anhydrase
MNKTDFPEGVLDKTPHIPESVFIAPGAHVMGDVTCGEHASIWYNAVVRGDINTIKIGEKTNIQDGCVLHLENDRACTVGNYVTVGHKAILHGCTIEDACLIGMGAIILNGAFLEKGSVIGAGAVVKENTRVKSGELWVGIPAKCVKTGLNVIEDNIKWAEKYVKLAKVHTLRK